MTHRILVTNDDGVHAPGLRRLAAALSGLGEIVVVAPDRERSAAGHSLTLHRPLRLKELEDGVYSVDGTPSDCVNLALLWLLRENPPALVVSGINAGSNLGDDVTYSGTVSAAFEGTLLGVPSVAFSLERGGEGSFDRAAAVAREIVRSVLARKPAEELLLNVNLPAGETRGLRLTRLGKRVYQQAVVEKQDPHGRRYFWIAGRPEWQPEEGTDYDAVRQGYVSVTPLHLDLTDYGGLETESWLAEAVDGRLGAS